MFWTHFHINHLHTSIHTAGSLHFTFFGFLSLQESLCFSKKLGNACHAPCSLNLEEALGARSYAHPPPHALPFVVWLRPTSVVPVGSTSSPRKGHRPVSTKTAGMEFCPSPIRLPCVGASFFRLLQISAMREPSLECNKSHMAMLGPGKCPRNSVGPQGDEVKSPEARSPWLGGTSRHVLG